MESPVKKINRWLIGFIIGGTLLGLSGEKGKGIMSRGVFTFVRLGRYFLDKAELRGSTLGGAKKNEKSSGEVNKE